MSKPIDWNTIHEADDDDDDFPRMPSAIHGESAAARPLGDPVFAGSSASSSGDNQSLLRPNSAPPHMMLSMSNSTSPGRKRAMGNDNEPVQQPMSNSAGDIHASLFPSSSTSSAGGSSIGSGHQRNGSRTTMAMWRSGSRAGSPHQAQSSSPPSAALAEQLRRTTLSSTEHNTPPALDAFEMSLRGQGTDGHFTTVERYLSRDDPLYQYSREFMHNIVPCHELVGMEDAMKLLEECIARPLTSVTAPCIGPIIVLAAPFSRGCSTLMRSFGSQCGCRDSNGPMPPLVNNITYRFFNGIEITGDFFQNLFRLASSMSPCTVTIHRPYGRGKNNSAYVHILHRIREAYIPYQERFSNMRIPLFWLVFIDEDVSAVQDLIQNTFDVEHRCKIEDFTPTQVGDYLMVRVRQQLRQILVNEADIEFVMTSHGYESEIRRVVEANPGLLNNPKDVNTYVRYLFSLPATRTSLTELRDRDSVEKLDPNVHLPYVPFEDELNSRDSDFSLAASRTAERAAAQKARAEAQALANERAQPSAADIAKGQSQMRNRRS